MYNSVTSPRNSDTQPSTTNGIRASETTVINVIVNTAGSASPPSPAASSLEKNLEKKDEPPPNHKYSLSVDVSDDISSVVHVGKKKKTNASGDSTISQKLESVKLNFLSLEFKDKR
jgi:hypothetical protein